uniref:Uncharacterized protein n=1 Tax=Nelumbo nucifera TaxID=4432 RepID=A0A822YXD3_NELNU|nr:TPA_asm: hypothetical protein HUJ06_007983 [Nelumbo nucifera]
MGRGKRESEGEAKGSLRLLFQFRERECRDLISIQGEKDNPLFLSENREKAPVSVLTA